ncbi:hypothetical protein THRCLA_22041 [Thraustotheca clavata]|uniref:Uncharacterized protein n=1 Tax=Thraustotheca clavata TaxID=74557 RepID=A0A1V9ZD70_9STRA|nr:hypothetical protein THRCLA_22041 [Thraustotheca clavata]
MLWTLLLSIVDATCVVQQGFYIPTLSTLNSDCSERLPCPPGSYCRNNQVQSCPPGVYGNKSELSTPHCSGLCPSGHYCPRGTIIPLPCGSPEVYCPLGSVTTIPVPAGYYSLGVDVTQRESIALCEPGFYCDLGTMSPCPSGTFGATPGLMTPTCSDICPAGSYCPEGSEMPTPCPSGTFGSTTGLAISTCSGLCPNAYYCPPGTINPIVCPDDSICPSGSSTSQIVDPGMYRAITIDPLNNVHGDLPIRTLLHKRSCFGKCPAGSFCPLGTITPTPCNDPSNYCPINTYTLLPVGVGNYSIPENSQYLSSQKACEPGYYCTGGIRTLCPPGTFGNDFGLSSASCSGLCAPGYFCPAGSKISTAHECGDPGVFCPQGSSQPQKISKGNCGQGLSSTTQSSQSIAPAGSFAFEGQCYLCPGGTCGSEVGLISPSCSGICAAGYFCPPGSISPQQNHCGLGFYCPSASAQPTHVTQGYYTYITTTDSCGPGQYRSPSTSLASNLLTSWSAIQVNYGDALFPFGACVPCPLGTFKPGSGDSAALCQPCPMYTSTSSSDRTTCNCFRLPGGISYDNTAQTLHFDGSTCSAIPLTQLVSSLIPANTSYTKYQQMPCEPGFYCVQGGKFPCPAGSYGPNWFETRPLCAGLCQAGYYCPVGSPHNAMISCGAPFLYCPAGSPYPDSVGTGYYSVSSILGLNSDPTLRDIQMPCEPGYFCRYGLKYPCPGGRYGSAVQETSSLCTGLCRRGYYCPPGSTSPTQIPCGSSSVVCRAGSAYPIAVSSGYYSGGDTLLTEARNRDSTRWYQKPCPLGSYCVNGIQYLCPGGTFGGIQALSTKLCSGLCAPGYYCPPGSFSAQQFACGASNVYCPAGSSLPIPVKVGYYTIGNINSTRVDQRSCEIGSFCSRGIIYECPSGTYGDSPGLTDETCSGWCSAGYYCPPGTTLPTSLPCNETSYSIAGQGQCTACPVARSPLPCQNSRACCQ